MLQSLPVGESVGELSALMWRSQRLGLAFHCKQLTIFNQHWVAKAPHTVQITISPPFSCFGQDECFLYILGIKCIVFICLSWCSLKIKDVVALPKKTCLMLRNDLSLGNLFLCFRLKLRLTAMRSMIPAMPWFYRLQSDQLKSSVTRMQRLLSSSPKGRGNCLKKLLNKRKRKPRYAYSYIIHFALIRQPNIESLWEDQYLEHDSHCTKARQKRELLL